MDRNQIAVTRDRVMSVGGALLIGLAVVVAGIVLAIGVRTAWAGLIYVVALLALGMTGIRTGARLRRKRELAGRSDAF